MSQSNRRPYYDKETIARIKQIPILDVCRQLGIEFEPRGNTYWCKTRPERTASTQIYPHDNTYYDHGTKDKGSNIDLICAYFPGTEWYEALQLIADAFAISPDNPRQGLKTGDLAMWEYEVIGLDGKMATRNFEFDTTKHDASWILKTSLRYAIPMNVLKNTNPGIYEELLWKHSIPRVRDLRQDYYLEVLSQYQLAKAVGSLDAFDKIVDSGEFDKMIKDLQTAERVLERACKGTKIKAYPVGEYDPKKDAEKILSGEVKLGLGNTTKSEMYKLAKKGETSVKYQLADLIKFMANFMDLEDFRHHAYLKDEKVMVAYLESDREKIKPLLDKMRISKENLNDKISDAQQRQGTPEESASGGKENPDKNNTNREERD